MAVPLDEMGNLQLRESERDEESHWNTQSNQYSQRGIDDDDDEDMSDDPEPSSSRHNDVDEDREAALRFELESVQNINSVIEGVIDSLDRAKENMGVILHPSYTQYQKLIYFSNYPSVNWNFHSRVFRELSLLHQRCSIPGLEYYPKQNITGGLS